MKNLFRWNLVLLAAVSLCVAAPLSSAVRQQSFAPASIGGAPVGSIVAWHLDLPGTPALPPRWQPCDGQMIVDPESPYVGQLLPDLNGEARYLRGGMVSGVLQDDATATNGLVATTGGAGAHTHSMGSAGAHTHSRTNVGGIGNTRGFAAAGNQSGSTSTSSAGNHTHSLSPAGDHTHPVSLSGDGETRPITMSVVWVMRIK